MSSSYDPMHDARAQVIELKTWAKKQGRLVFILAVIIIAGLCLISSYYQVEPDEVGVLLRFGKYVDTSEPGPHFKLPFGIDTVIKVPQRTLKMEFGFRTSRPNQINRYERTSAAEAESVVLTGDLNVGIVEWIIQYRITNPEKYLFSFRDINTTMRLVSEAAVRAIVGDHSIDELLTSGREEIENKAKDLLVEMFARYDIGVTVQQLKLQEANVPERVRPALTSVEEAKQERERSINEAWAEYNQEVPRARGAAEREPVKENSQNTEETPE